MPNYWNPYNFYPASYMNQYSGIAPQVPTLQQSFAQPQNQGPKMMEWVEGEVGAKAYQMPNGWPANSPIPLWDSTDTIIWLKSWGPMGIPNPMQKLKYELPDQQSNQLLMSGSTGNDQKQAELSQYVTKDDLEQMKKEIRNMLNKNNAGNNQNGRQMQQGGGESK